MDLLRSFQALIWSSIGILLFAGSALAQSAVGTSSPGIFDECSDVDVCVDQYLWSLYERTPKLDTLAVPEQRKVLVKRKHKAKFITVTYTKLVDEDFAWKDPEAAQKAGMSLKDYVIGGMDRRFKLTLYQAMLALDYAGFVPGITSAFRDDYRQSIATGLKAHSECSFHGGSFRGGYGHGLAADIVSVRGDTRADRYASSEDMWKWVDGHEQDLGIGRPYLDHDPPHVGPTSGQEYVAHRYHIAFTPCRDLQAAPVVAARQPQADKAPETTQSITSAKPALKTNSTNAATALTSSTSTPVPMKSAKGASSMKSAKAASQVKSLHRSERKPLVDRRKRHLGAA
jgi:hypothetical protein